MSIPIGFFDQSTPGPSGPITAWDWDFGDGGTSTSENPVHNYASPGDYSVRLEVTGTSPDGTDSVTIPITVVPGDVLTAQFSSTVSGLSVTFADLSIPGPSGPITAWDWDFGDGSSHGTTQNPSHTYASADTYTVTLTVTGTSPDGTDPTSQPVVVTSASPNFVSATNGARPSFTPTRTVHFSTKAQLDAAIADMTAGDLIQYNGTGVLTISSGSGTAYTLANKNPATDVVIDFGCARNIWDPSTITGNHVKFAYTGSSNIDCFYIHDCSHLRIYGGEFNSGIGGAAIRVRGAMSSVRMWDWYVSQAGSHGIQIQPANPSTGAAETITGCHFRGEVNRFCMNPANDPHNDKGTGFHGCLWHDTNHGTITSSEMILYAHDSLQPGATSAGKTWPEGGGGSGIEIGTVGDASSNNTFYILGENLLMIPNGTNPGSTGKQTGGNVAQHWGSTKLNGHVFGWVEGNNCTGAVTHGAGGTWFPGSPAISVTHGRHSNVNQSHEGSNTTTPYDTTHGIVYHDAT